MRQLSDEGAYSIGEPCPFAAGGYQVMRNIAAGAALTIPGNSEWRVIFAWMHRYLIAMSGGMEGFSVRSLW